MDNQKEEMKSTVNDQLNLLREPFSPNQISMLPKPTCKKEFYDKLPKAKCKECGGYHATSKTIHLSYVGHAALTDRLLSVDPTWTWEPMSLTDDGLPLFDASGGLWIKLTVCGVTRLGYGHAKPNTFADIGSREKEVIGDALRNSAMRFGCALDLWSKADLSKMSDDQETEPVINAAFFTDKLDQEIVNSKGKEHLVVSSFLEKNKKQIDAMAKEIEDIYSYVADMVKEYPAPRSVLFTNIRDACKEYQSIDLFTEEWESRVVPYLPKLDKEEAKLAEQCRIETINRLQGENQ